MRIDLKRSICLGIMAAALLPSSISLAEYRSSSTETGINRLDYIENQKRVAREKALNEEEQKLAEESAKMRAERKKPLDPNKPSPAAFEGDEIFYDMETGDAFAKGHVKVTQEEGRRLLTDEAKGNLKTKDVYVEDEAYLMQLVPMQTRVRLKGWHTDYNYEKKTGKMFEANGKVGNHYIKAHKVEFYPDRVLLYESVATKCGAKKPDYRWEAEYVEVFPNDIMILHDVDFYIGGMLVFHKDRYVADISGKTEEIKLPKVGYDSDDGWWISQDTTTPIADKVFLDAYILFMSHQKFKSNTELRWANGGNSLEVQYGYYRDSDDNWIKKYPSFIYSYGNRIGKSAFSYSLHDEIGHWYDRGKRSIHHKYGVSLSHAPITFCDNFRLYLSAGYDVTKETYDHSTSKGWSYSGLLMKDIGPAVTVYTGYSYSATNSQNTVFNYGLNDYSRKLEYGLSVKITPRDRLVFGQYYDVHEKRQREVDCYWFHDMHCAQFIVRYRIERDKKERQGTVNVSLQFTPW